MRSASRWSWWVTPSTPSITSSAASARSTACSARTRLKYSVGSSMRLRRRMPAVSTNRSGPSSVSITVSIASRVVPGMSCTIARSAPTIRLNRVDLPTLGRPTIAIEKRCAPPSSSSVADDDSGGTGGSRVVMWSSRSPLPRPWMALTDEGSPSPRRANGQMSPSRRSSSTLLTTTTTGTPDRCSTWATPASSSVTPTVASPTNSTTSASASATSAWRLTWRARGCAPSPDVGASHPPVSTTRKRRPFHSATSSFRSRVTPGSSCTIASRRPTNRLTNVDFPTFGRPTTATTGRRLTRCSSRSGGLTRRRGHARVTPRRWPRPRRGPGGRRSWCRRGTGRSTARRPGPARVRPGRWHRARRRRRRRSAVR